MTTVAWDGKTLAADTCMSGAYIAVFTKTFQLPDGRLFAGAGEIQDILLAVKWLTEGGDRPELDAMNSILIYPDGRAFFLDEKLVEMRINESIAATGSGAQFAIAALYLGASAEKAIEVAAHFDTGTSLPTTKVRLKRSVLRK